MLSTVRVRSSGFPRSLVLRVLGQLFSAKGDSTWTKRNVPEHGGPFIAASDDPLATLTRSLSMSRIARAAVSIVVLSGAFIPAMATAQRAGDMTIGVMAGVNYATVNQDPESSDVSFGYKLGFVGGGFLGEQGNDRLSI